MFISINQKISYFAGNTLISCIELDHLEIRIGDFENSLELFKADRNEPGPAKFSGLKEPRKIGLK